MEMDMIEEEVHLYFFFLALERGSYMQREGKEHKLKQNNSNPSPAK